MLTICNSHGRAWLLLTRYKTVYTVAGNQDDKMLRVRMNMEN